MKCYVKICGELALAALVIVALAVVVHLQLSAITKFHLADFLAIVLGGVVVLIALFGFSGAFRMSHCMLIIYAVIMLLATLVKLTFALMIFAKLEFILKRIPHWLEHSFRNLESFNSIESTFRCCGAHSPADYNLQLPDTCCLSKPCTEYNAYQGCSVVLHNFFNTFGIPAAVLALVVGLIELIAIVVVLTLIHHSRKKDEKLKNQEKVHFELGPLKNAEKHPHQHVSDNESTTDHKSLEAFNALAADRDF